MSQRFQHFYLIEIQYLGFRLHGWQYQNGLKTVQGFLELTVNFVLKDKPFKVMGSGRTDAMVSAASSYFELFLEEPIQEDAFFQAMNQNLPTDLKILSWRTVTKEFNIIQDVQSKEYNYFFAFGEKQHPFSAPFMACLPDELDIELMQKGAGLFEGGHDFVHFCHQPKADKNTVREIITSEIIPNEELKANFFPDKSYIFRLIGKGFMRYQIRMMMGVLFMLGQHKITLDQLQQSLTGGDNNIEKYTAPASGLMVKAVTFKNV
ncbi:tRNA pseudouridine(38-40) synthase TruA [Marivirga sp. S37H4]|uniref:tRNA pseudouridine synthase A n=1 Tax=Marivirga aurantiaca TaxID=2802615 RepID=A0A934X0A5_9BACT|nr:tRNA pseudouridine(38-40) synthase TruA [Marivirga aurantiaca]MBK6266299.1 tRNA pseudouridine(38-40) synthase TruA [Marivirga aurantiaca]